MTELRKAVLRTVRLDDEVWLAVKRMECSLNQYLREALLGNGGATEGQIDPDGRDSTLRDPYISPVVLPVAAPFEEVIPDRRPKNCRCLHCPSRFAGPRGASICPACKSSGHTLRPAECPRCNEGSAI